MKKIIVLLVLLAVVASGNSVFAQSAAKEKSTGQKESVYYTCPMHPEVKSDKPGKCPTCGMALVKSSEAAGKHQMKMDCGMMGGMKMDIPKDSTKASNSAAVTYICPMDADV